MAKSPNDFRDPKVTSGTSDTSSGGGIGKWIAIAVGVLLALLLLAWLLGLFASDEEVDAVVVPEAETGTVVEEDAEGVVVEQ